ncbi:MAG: hypothetical protein WA902_24310 [Thermosynechococcaceae cyanobacterium]
MSVHKVLCVKRYKFNDDDGNLVTGCKVTFLDEPEKSEDLKGVPPMTVTSDYEFWHQFPTVPGDYDLDFRMRPDAKGKPQLRLMSAAPVPQ